MDSLEGTNRVGARLPGASTGTSLTKPAYSKGDPIAHLVTVRSARKKFGLVVVD